MSPCIFHLVSSSSLTYTEIRWCRENLTKTVKVNGKEQPKSPSAIRRVDFKSNGSHLELYDGREVRLHMEVMARKNLCLDVIALNWVTGFRRDSSHDN